MVIHWRSFRIVRIGRKKGLEKLMIFRDREHVFAKRETRIGIGQNRWLWV